MQTYCPVLRRLVKQLAWGILVLASFDVSGAFAETPVPAGSAARQAIHQLDIEPGMLHDALRQLARQVDVQLAHFSDTIPRSLRSGALRGSYTLDQALARLLEGTGLTYRFANERTVVIIKTAGAPQHDSPTALRPAERGDQTAPRARGWLARLATFFSGCGASPGAICAEEGDFARIEEVVVTAQKHEELLQETPIAITAFSATELEIQRVTNVMDLLNKVPSLNLAPFAGTRVAPNLFIRGMGNLTVQTTKDNATGIYIDGVPVGRSTGLAADIVDLERIEVLRGPQGTLWGRNTTAGAINFITRKPHEELSFGVQATAGSWDLRSGRVTINVPVTDTFFMRAAYMRTKNDGWIDNLNTTLPNQINFNEDRKKESMKLAVRFRPTTNFMADYAFDRSEMIFGNHFYQIMEGASAVPGRQEVANQALGMYPSATQIGGHNLTLTWEFGGTTLKSITAYRDLESWTYQNYIDIFSQTNVQDQSQFSQEMQFLGDAAGGRLRYAAGLFYFEEDSNESLTSAYSVGALLDIFHVTARSRSMAIYGQATWTPPVLDGRLGITVGARYTEDSRKAIKVFDSPGLAPEFSGLVVSGNRDFSSFDPTATLDYAFTDVMNGYVKFSTGYRAGGYNAQGLPTNFGLGFEPETVEAWEVGFKSDLLGNRLRLNVAAFRNKYDDLQVDQVRTPPIHVDTLNAGSAEIKGIEVESTAVLAPGLNMNFYYSWLDGKYNSYIDNGVERAQERYLPNTPDWHYGAGLDYTFPHMAIGDFSLHVDYRKQDEFLSNPMTYSRSPGYQVWNARLQLANIPVQGGGTFRLAVWSKNLSDEIYRLSTTHLGLLSAQFGAPRSFGVDAAYEF